LLILTVSVGFAIVPFPNHQSSTINRQLFTGRNLSMQKYFAKFSATLVVALVLAGVFALIAPETALAHGRREVAGGKYQLAFGFIHEPAFVSQMNGIDLRVCEGACKTQDGKTLNPVKDVHKTLKAQAIFGSQTLDVELKPRYNAEGSYDGYFMPLSAGEYTFRFYGEINGDKIDERVTSGKDGFNSVEAPKTLGTASAATVDPQVKEARDSAGTAFIFGIVGTIFGAIGIAMAAFALSRKPAGTSGSFDRDIVGSGRHQQGG
jgi:hypothetical protein